MISIIFPVYNVAGYLEASLKSCINQTYQDIEIVAVNDGSTDKSLDILMRYAEQDSRIKIVNQNNQGVAKARSIGVQKASGDFVTFVDSDDIIPINSIEILYKTLEQNDADIAVGNYCEYYDHIKYNKMSTFPKASIITSLQFLELILSQHIQWGLCAKLYKKEFFENIITPPFRLGEDAGVLIQVVTKVQSIALVNKCVYEYLQRPDSAVHSKPSPHITDIFKFRLWIAEFLSGINYHNTRLVDQFVVTGYIECLFQGGRKYLTELDYACVRKKYQYVKRELFNWQKIIFMTANRSFLNCLVIKMLRRMRDFKFVLIVLCSKQLN